MRTYYELGSARDYLESVSNLKTLKPQKMAAPIRYGSVSSPIRPGNTMIAVGVGGSAAAACFFSRCLAFTGICPSVFLPLEEADRLSSAQPEVETIFITASGQHPSMCRTIERLIGRGRCPLVLTLDSNSSVARMIGNEAPERIVVPTENLYSHEYISTYNLAMLLWLSSEYLFGDIVASQVIVAIRDTVIRGSDVSAHLALDEVTRIVVISDALGRAPALDFGARCREFGRLPVTEVSLSDFVHGSHIILRKQTDIDIPWIVAFVENNSASAIRDALGRKVSNNCLSIYPIMDAGALSQASGIANSISLHSRLISCRWSTWTAFQDEVGAYLWSNLR